MSCSHQTLPGVQPNSSSFLGGFLGEAPGERTYEARAEGFTHPTVLVPIHNLRRDGFGVATLGAHFFPQSVVLGDVHQIVLDVLSI